MWVQGDLKDQLGLKHRKARKTPTTNQINTLEAAPMFQGQHSRSLSELSSNRDLYEPANTSSPPPAQRIRPTRLDTPPLRMADELPIVDIPYKKNSNQETTHLTPYPAGHRVEVAPSPQPSYYSASDIPIPSPLPPTQYKYPDGEVTTNPPSRRTSIGTTRHVAGQGSLEYVEAEATASSSSQLQPLSPSPTMFHVPGSSSSTFELHVRPPPDEYLVGTAITRGHPHERETTAASYTTADDDWIPAEDARDVVAMPQPSAQSLVSEHQEQHPLTPRPAGRSPSPRAIAIVGDRRDPTPVAPWTDRDSGGWDGGVAL